MEVDRQRAVVDRTVTATRGIVIRSILALVLCALLVTLCYYFVDRPVAWFVHDHAAHWWVLKWATFVPPYLARLAPLVLAAVVVWRAWRPGNRTQRVLLALALSLIAAVAIKEQLKWGFGRYWPETWAQDNPSLIGSGAYGFHPFHKGVAYESFPSGHTTVVFSLISVLWGVFPRWRWLWTLPGLAIAAALLGMNYHFVGDIVAGAFLGSIVGVYSQRFVVS